ncbi:hypothetical protein BH11MYX2_BH11MYX2_12990 [soil metagenome]
MTRSRENVPPGTRSARSGPDPLPRRRPIGTPAPVPPLASPANPLVPIALVSVDDETMVVARVETWVVHDPFERAVLSTALQLSYQRPVVLLSKEPCGCREMWGDSALLAKLTKVPDAAFHWQMMRVSFAAH